MQCASCSVEMFLARTLTRNVGPRSKSLLDGLQKGNQLNSFRVLPRDICVQMRRHNSSFRNSSSAVTKLVNEPKFMSAEENRKRRWPIIIEEFARFPGDTGSPEVQVALLTEKVRYLTEHFRTHKKDKHGLKGLRAILNRRLKLLLYLRRKDAERYFSLIEKLGLKDRLSDRLL